jgi:serine/threonine-protein kinase
MGILTKHLYEAPVPPRELSPPADCPPAMEAVILKCLQKKPEQRYQSMAELASDLDAVERGHQPRAGTEGFARTGPQTLTGVEARVPGFETTPDLTIRKNRTPMFIGVGAAVVIAGAGLWMVLGKSAATPTDQVSSPTPNTPNTPNGRPNDGTPGTPPAAAKQPEESPSRPATPEAPVAATLQLSSEPDGADVYADGRRVGSTPHALTKPEPGKTLKLQLRKGGFEDKTVDISSETGDLVVQLERVPAKEPVRSNGANGNGATGKRSPKSGAKPAQPTQPARRDPAPAPSTDVLDPWN